MNKIKIVTISLCMLITFNGCFDNKKSLSVKIMIGLDSIARDDYDKAIKTFSDILSKDPKSLSALYYRGISYYKKGDHASGLNDFEKLYDIDKDFNLESRYLWDVAINCFINKRDYVKSIGMFNFFIEKFPKNGNIALAYMDIANCYLKFKDFDKAILSYQKVIDLFENAGSLQEKRIANEAKATIDFIKGNSDFERKPLTMYSDIQTETDPVKKIEVAKKILELYPECNLADKIQYQIAKLYSVDGLNDFDQALKEYQLFIKKYPKSPLVKAVENSILGITEKYDSETGKLGGTIH